VCQPRQLKLTVLKLDIIYTDMGLFDALKINNKSKVKIEFLESQLEKIEKQKAKADRRIINQAAALQRVQNIRIDLDTASNVTGKAFTGNNYKSYEQAITAIKSKYCCTADWGVLLTGVIIDLRTALIQGGEIEITTRKSGDKEDKPTEFETAWVEEFMKYNKLNDYQAFEIIKMPEMEGRLLLKIEFDREYEWRFNGKLQKGMMAVIPHSYSDSPYTVTTNKFKKPDGIVFADQYQQDFLDEREFVYRKFGGMVNDYNNPVMRIWRCLTNIENVDKAIRDLRKINHIFAAPKIYVSVSESGDVDEMVKQVNENWKAATISVLTGDLKCLQVDVQHVHVLIKEAYFNIQEIGSVTGLPVHWLSLVDLMSNRSTAEALGDVTDMAVSTERKIIFDGFNELLRKSIDMYNSERQMTKIANDMFEIKPNIISEEQWKHLKEVFVELTKNNKFPLHELYKLIPGVNADEVYKAFIEELSKDYENKYVNFSEPDTDENDDKKSESEPEPDIKEDSNAKRREGETSNT